MMNRNREQLAANLLGVIAALAFTADAGPIRRPAHGTGVGNKKKRSKKAKSKAKMAKSSRARNRKG
jgi:hypothetical protein